MKDTYFFSHDFGARNDPKLQNILMEHGCEGLGVYWCIVEMLYEEGGTLPLLQCKCIAFALHVECKIVESIINDFNVFQNDGTMFWSNSVNNRLNKRKKISDNRKHAAIKRWKSDTEMQKQCKSNAKVPICNAIKGKEKKGNNIDTFLLEKEKISKEKACETRRDVSSSENDVIEIEPEYVESESVPPNETKAALAHVKKERFKPPTPEEVLRYCEEKQIRNVNVDAFCNFYASKGWKVGKNTMKDWKAAVRGWAARNLDNNMQARNSQINKVAAFAGVANR